MPKHQSTAAKRARRAARQGAKYTQALRAQTGVLEEIREGVTVPGRRPWLLIALAPEAAGGRVFTPHRSTWDVYATLEAAYAAALDRDPALMPAREAVEAAVEEVAAAVRPVASTGPYWRVVEEIRRQAAPLHRVMAPLDRAARILVEHDREALAEHWPARSGRVRPETRAAAVALDTALAVSLGLPAPGDPLTAPDGATTILRAIWEQGDRPVAVETSYPAGAEDLTVPLADLARTDQGWTCATPLSTLASAARVRQRAARPSGPVAVRDWHTRALVRITQDCTTSAPDSLRPRHWRAGEVVELVRWGRAGAPVKDSWWTGYDIDASHILPADCVEVVEVLEEVPPT